MKKWVRFIQIAIPSVMAVTIIAVPLAVHYGIEEKILYVPTNEIVVDSTTGAGDITIPFYEQTQDNKVLVSVINKSGDNLVTLFLDGENPYSSQNSLIFPVIDNKIHVNFSFAKFQGDNISAVFDLEVDYVNSHNVTKTKFAKDMKLSTAYHREENIQHVHILDINDIHGAAPGYGEIDFSTTSPKNPGVVRLMDKVSDILLNNPGSVFLSAGDNNSGEAFSSSTHAESMYPILSAMGIDYSAVGNHAFEWGYDDLTTDKFDHLGRTSHTLGRYLINANILEHPYYQDHRWAFNPRVKDYDEEAAERDYTIWKNQRVDWADPYKLVNLDGHLVCLVGLTTQKAMSDGNQDIVQNTSMIDYAPAIYYATRYCFDTVGADWYNSIETFIMLTHIESDENPADNDALFVAANSLIYDPDYEDDHDFHYHEDPCKKISLVISGHSHKEVSKPQQNTYSKNNVWVGQANTAGRAFLDSNFTFDNSKPVGKRWKSVELNIEKVKPDWGGITKDPSLWTDEEKEIAFNAANTEITNLMENPRNELVKRVIDEYKIQKEIVKNKLLTKVAYSETGHSYSPIGPGKAIGHEYIMPDHVVEEAGSLTTAASIIGFDSIFKDEILSPTSSVTYPAISFIGIDSINGEVAPHSDVTLENIYNLQQHDNTIHFGFLSVWQLAAIIDYSLAGGVLTEGGDTYFKYADYNRSYVSFPKDIPGAQDYANDRNLTQNYHAYEDETKSIQLASESTISDDMVCYPAGPMQWYGFKFGVNKITDETKKKALGRDLELKYVPKRKDDPKYEVLDQDYFPDIQIYDPLKDTAISTFYNPDAWVDVQDWLIEKDESWHGLIPCVISDFLYIGGNHQFGMIPQYFDYNMSEYGKNFGQTLFSTLIRDLVIEYSRLSQDPIWKTEINFDGTHNITPELIDIPK